MISKKLKKYNITLGSESPRRKKLLSKLEIKFNVRITKSKENYPKKLKTIDIPKFLAKQKAQIISQKLSDNYLLITADTIVLKNNNILHRPKNQHDAIKILHSLSGEKHKVITGVCIKSNKKEEIFSSVTEVFFNELSAKEVTYYIEKYKPYDKAGSYGIQEWIGHIGIEKIIGSYNNIIGLPTAKLYQKLKLFI